MTEHTVQSFSDEQSFENKYNFIFHIYSKHGKPVNQFIGSGSATERMNSNVVLFESGSEFLVCATHKDQKNPSFTHVYMRQIDLGWSQHVIHWLDPKANEYDL